VESSPLDALHRSRAGDGLGALPRYGPAATAYRGAELVPITYADGTSDDWRPPRSGKVHM